MVMTKAEIEGFNEYVNSKTWKNAKTFENFAPHSYIVSYPCEKMKDEFKCKGNCEECSAEREEFEKWVQFIRDNGERAVFMKRQYIMLCLDGFQYWTMGDPLETTWILNRAIENDPRCKLKTYWLNRKM